MNPIRLRVVTPTHTCIVEIPATDKTLRGIPIDMLNRGVVYVGGARRHPDEAWQVLSSAPRKGQ
jgi:hypothetical protein